MYPYERWNEAYPRCVPGLTWDELQEHTRKYATPQWVFDVILNGHDHPFLNFYPTTETMIEGDAKIYPFSKKVISDIVRKRKKGFYKEFQHVLANVPSPYYNLESVNASRQLELEGKRRYLSNISPLQ